MSSLLKGTFILTMAMIVSRILSFAYIVPFTLMVGTQGYILFEYAFKPYIVIISIATMGVPLAVSKFTSKYTELGDYYTIDRLLKSGLVLMTITGIISCLGLYLSAPFLAGFLTSEADPTGNSIEDVTFVIQMISFALVMVPMMALLRGYFQGQEKMAPTGVSQMIEQLVRLSFILIASYIIMNYGNGSIRDAVGYSTFAALLGAIAGMIVLIHYWLKHKNERKEKLSQSKKEHIPLSSIYKELISYALPFVLVNLALPFFQLIDTFMINSSLMSIGYKQIEAETMNSIIALCQKIINLPVVLATAFSLALVPIITRLFVGKSYKEMHTQITKTLQIVLFFTLPATILFFVLAEPTYVTLFGSTNATDGGNLMRVYAPITIFYALFTVTAAILQGMDRQKAAVFSLILGIIIKIATNHLFIVYFEADGTSYTTIIGLGISILLNIYFISKYGEYKFKEIFKQGFVIILITFVSGIFMWLVPLLLKDYLHSILNNYFTNVSILLLGTFVGGIVYIVISYYFDILGELLGHKFNFLKRKNHNESN